MYKRRITVRGIIFDGKCIFAQQLKQVIAKGGDYWCTPGGGVDDGEDVISALKREMIEETGIEPEIGNLLFIQQYKESENYEHIVFLIHITNVEDYRDIDLSKTSHGEQEVSDYGFVDPKTTNILPVELQTIDIQKHIDTQAPAEFFIQLNS